MLPARTSSFVPAVPATAAPEEIARAVSNWQARYQPIMPVVQPAPLPVETSIEAPAHIKEAAANWFAEARRQDAADQDEVRSRVSRILGKGVLG
jgi:hypothetical protein